ncbi:MAG TPA: DUF2160 family membrane protein [Aggregatilinea sp.]|uniref:DUF2160 family membrane protein n=1 Tax=Aggregatilinea sp. TaxID=2806333 RepID=UPI002C2A1DA0|nr:DUF2160 family membrane protein [Aggregatilinea sp.]HML21368.1 DUF2160 family membrane protein [Aggregatilinea sp.]
MHDESFYDTTEVEQEAEIPSVLPSSLPGKLYAQIHGKRRGFLPFETNPWDRIFIGLLLTVAIHLLWMRFLEEYITLTIATILSLIIMVILFVRG